MVYFQQLFVEVSFCSEEFALLLCSDDFVRTILVAPPNNDFLSGSSIFFIVGLGNRFEELHTH